MTLECLWTLLTVRIEIQRIDTGSRRGLTGPCRDALATVEVFLSQMKRGVAEASQSPPSPSSQQADRMDGIREVLRVIVTAYFRGCYGDWIISYANERCETIPDFVGRGAKIDDGWWMDELIVEMSKPPAAVESVSGTYHSNHLLSKSLVLPHLSLQVLRTLFPSPPSSDDLVDKHGNMAVHNALLLVHWCSEMGMDPEKCNAEALDYVLTLTPAAAYRHMVLPVEWVLKHSNSNAEESRKIDNVSVQMPLQFVARSPALGVDVGRILHRFNRLALATLLEEFEWSAEPDIRHKTKSDGPASKRGSKAEPKTRGGRTAPRFVLAGAIASQRREIRGGPTLKADDLVMRGKSEELVMRCLLKRMVGGDLPPL